ncbi:septal ring lytic transglycosylase RlpA family protein [Alphaproteobacteria bacterium]|nr:septal ring lytic transglycosylase RlpA family protein [Alphaproteobacteria bacterium]MDC1023347.1 septal ring lytic transglycosylase RlpA family protein [Alphaproteobacteria bacterium]
MFSNFKKSIIINTFKINFFLIAVFLLQSCTSGIEVAANLGKKYLIPKENNATSQRPIFKIGNKYKIRGKYYFPNKDLYYNETGIASWYGPKFHGKITANGEIYDQNAFTAAHRTLPLPSAVKVTNLQNNISVVLRINDRGPFVNDRIIDLSSKAADILDLKKNGTGLVRVTIMKNESEILENLAKRGYFPEIKDLPKTDFPKVNVPKVTNVKVIGSKKKKSYNKINYDLKNLNNDFKIFIKLASFNSFKSAKLMKEKLSYVENVNIYKTKVSNKVIYQVKAGPFLNVKKVDKLHSLLLERGMQGAKIVIE